MTSLEQSILHSHKIILRLSLLCGGESDMRKEYSISLQYQIELMANQLCSLVFTYLLGKEVWHPSGYCLVNPILLYSSDPLCPPLRLGEGLGEGSSCTDLAAEAKTTNAVGITLRIYLTRHQPKLTTPREHARLAGTTEELPRTNMLDTPDAVGPLPQDRDAPKQRTPPIPKTTLTNAPAKLLQERKLAGIAIPDSGVCFQ